MSEEMRTAHCLAIEEAVAAATEATREEERAASSAAGRSDRPRVQC